jgi:predicted aldo/keto reductase-like oxidoreductase
MKNTKLNRRKFLRNSSLGFLGAGLLGKKSLAAPFQDQENELPKIKEYRTLGRTGFKISDIGCGSPPNESVLKAVLKTGVNYIDTSEFYGKGNQEKMIGECIRDFDRKKIFITTKVFSRPEFNSRENVLSRVRKSLERLQTDYIDCLMIHEATDSKIVKNEYFHSAMDQLKSEGKVKYVGISCHGHNWREDIPSETMEQILGTAIDDGRFDVLLLAYNVINQSEGNRILTLCKKKNIGATVMKSNPLAKLELGKAYFEQMEKDSIPIPKWMTDLIDKFTEYGNQLNNYVKNHNLKSEDRILRDISIPFVLENPTVSTVLYTFLNFNDIENVIPISGKKLTAQGKTILDQYVKNFGALHCHIGCGICESECPHNVPVNTILRYNYYFTNKQQEKYAMQKYSELPGGKPDVCLTCEGFCEKACPYGVLTRPLLAMAHHNLSFDSPKYC